MEDEPRSPVRCGWHWCHFSEPRWSLEGKLPYCFWVRLGQGSLPRLGAPGPKTEPHLVSHKLSPQKFCAVTRHCQGDRTGFCFSPLRETTILPPYDTICLLPCLSLVFCFTQSQALNEQVFFLFCLVVFSSSRAVLIRGPSLYRYLWSDIPACSGPRLYPLPPRP